MRLDLVLAACRPIAQWQRAFEPPASRAKILLTLQIQKLRELLSRAGGETATTLADRQTENRVNIREPPQAQAH
jgi:hypothetical protein